MNKLTTFELIAQNDKIFINATKFTNILKLNGLKQ